MNQKTMKKIYSFIVAAVAMFAAVACTQEFENNTTPELTGETVVYTASIDDADTKATLNETTKKSEWVANDAITVHDGEKGWKFTAAEDGANVDFSNSEGFGDYRPVLAVYPAEKEGITYTADAEAKTVKANIPTYQQAQAGTYHSPAALAVAYSEDNTFAFKNAHALLMFTVGTDNVTHVIFHGNNEEAITGDVNVTLGKDCVKSVECLQTKFTWEDKTTSTQYGTWVECYAYHDNDNKYFTKGQNYYIAVAPQVFDGGVTVKVQIDEGDELVAKTTTKRVETKINTILNLGEIKYEDYWGLIGSMAESDWGTDLVLTEEGDYLVYKGVTLSTTDEFKFRKNGAWNEQKIARGGLAAVNTEYDLVDAGSSNMKVSTDGTYDIYLKKDLSKVYCMETGKTPDQAVQPDLSNTYRFYVQNNVGWSTLNFYAWGGYGSASWPGDKMTNSANVDGYGICKYIEITKGVSVVNFIINNGSKQTKDLKVSENPNVKTLSNGDMIYILTDSDVK